MLEVYCRFLVSINTFRKSLQTTSASYYRMCRILTTSVPSTTSKQCFEQPATSFLVCFLIFIEYNFTLLYIVEFQKAHESSEK